MKEKVISVWLIGAKSIAMYGGYEAFIDKLLEYHKDNKNIHYYVYCKANGDGHMDVSKLSQANMINDREFTYYNALCSLIHVPAIGHLQAIYYDIKALNETCKFIKRENIENPIIYIMACRIGPFIRYFVKRIHKFNGKVYLNPDGHEWKRAKWPFFVRKYWKESERLMVKEADLCICDSLNIEKYIQNEYARYHPKTTFSAYGADISPSEMSDDNSKYIQWLQQNNLESNQYYMSCGRFVPENNFEIMIQEFMHSKTKKDFVIITTSNDAFLLKLEKKLHFKADSRIKFVGAIYDQKLLKKIRENAYAYLHGHSVGGTNPSLLEALSSTKLNLLYNVSFNQEVAKDTAVYWTKEYGNLAKLIDKVDKLSVEEIEWYGKKAKSRIKEAYSWQFIADQYADIFMQ